LRRRCPRPERHCPDRDLIRDRQERLLEEQRRLEELQQLPGRETQAQPVPPSDDERCFEIQTIRLQGANQLNALLKAVHRP
jgi:hemolysin activation/secretion protein